MRIVSLASGSGGNCTLLSDMDINILIDAGISARRICRSLQSLELTPEQISGILITHEHNDHINGLKTLLGHYNIPVFAPRTVANHLCWSIPGVEDFIEELKPGREDCISGLSVLPFLTPHDTPQSVGYRITGSCSFGFCTDCGYISNDILEGLLGVDAAVIEANHDVAMLMDGNYPPFLKKRILSDRGHLSNECCGELAMRLYEHGARKLLLGHLSRANNTPKLAMKAVCERLGRDGISAGRDISIDIAPEKDMIQLSVEESARC